MGSKYEMPAPGKSRAPERALPISPEKKEAPPAPLMSRIETLARSSKYSEQARRSLRKDYEAFKKGGEVAVQNRHRIETQYFESRSPEIAVAVDRGDIGRPLALMLLRHFPHLNEKQIKEIVSGCFRERRSGESVDLFRQKRAEARANLSVVGLDPHDVRAIVLQCTEMMGAYKVLERRGIREASVNWPKRADGSPRNMMINRSKLVSLSYDIYKEAHPDANPEFREGLRIHRYEYRDVDGRRIATAHVQYRPLSWGEQSNLAQAPGVQGAKERYGDSAATRKMVSCILEIPRTGKKIDILRMTGQKSAQIFIVDSERAIDGIKTLNSNRVFVPEINTTHRFFSLLHELGHNDQELDLGYRNVAGDGALFEEVRTQKVNARGLRLEEKIRKIGELVSRGKHRIRDQIMTKRDMEDALTRFKEVNDLLVKHRRRPIDWNLMSQDGLGEVIAFLAPREPDETKRFVQFLEGLSQRIQAFIDWRARFSERDASRRALQWFRQLKKYGADFSRPTAFSTEREFFGGTPISLDTMMAISRQGGATVQDISKIGLYSQGASNEGMRDFYRQAGVKTKKLKNQKK